MRNHTKNELDNLRAALIKEVAKIAKSKNLSKALFINKTGIEFCDYDIITAEIWTSFTLEEILGFLINLNKNINVKTYNSLTYNDKGVVTVERE